MGGKRIPTAPATDSDMIQIYHALHFRGAEVFPSDLARPRTAQKSQLARELKVEINRRFGSIECGGGWS